MRKQLRSSICFIIMSIQQVLCDKEMITQFIHLTGESFVKLRHKHLGHILKHIDWLVSDRVLDPMDLTNNELYVEYIKRNKQILGDQMLIEN